MKIQAHQRTLEEHFISTENRSICHYNFHYHQLISKTPLKSIKNSINLLKSSGGYSLQKENQGNETMSKIYGTSGGVSS